MPSHISSAASLVAGYVPFWSPCPHEKSGITQRRPFTASAVYPGQKLTAGGRSASPSSREWTKVVGEERYERTWKATCSRTEETRDTSSRLYRFSPTSTNCCFLP